MKIKTNELKSLVKDASRAVARQTIISVMECVKVEAKDGIITITGSSNQMRVRRCGQCEGDLEPIAINARLLGEFVDKVRSDTVTIVKNEGVINMKAGALKLKLPLADVEAWTELSTTDKPKAQYTVDAAELSGKAAAVMHATGGNADMMKSVYMEVGENGVKTIGLDGFRVAIRNGVEPGNHSDVLIEGTILRDALSLVDGDVTVAVYDTLVGFASTDVDILVRQTEGKYYSIEHILKVPGKQSFDVDRRELIEAVSAAAMIDRQIILEIDGKGTTRIHSSSQYGDFDADIVGGTEELRIGFDGTYVLDALKSLDAKTVNLTFGESKSPCRITKEGAVEIILPIAIR